MNRKELVQPEAILKINWQRCPVEERYYIGFPGYLTVLLASDFYFMFLCCNFALKIDLNCKFLTEICYLKCIR